MIEKIKTWFATWLFKTKPANYKHIPLTEKQCQDLARMDVPERQDR